MVLARSSILTAYGHYWRDTTVRCASPLRQVILYCLNAFCQRRNRGERSLEGSALAINHVALEYCITSGKSGIDRRQR